MKIAKFLLILSAFLCFSSICYGESLESRIKSGKINWQASSPSSVAAKANQMQSFNPPPYAGVMQDPMVNSVLNGYGNMIQGINNNSYNAVEQQKQQRDFSKQQFEQPAD